MGTVKSACSALAIGLSVVCLPSLGKADSYNFYDSSNNLIATASTSTVGSNVQVDLSIVESNWFFIQAGNPPVVGINTTPTPTLVTAPTQNPGGNSVWALGIPGGKPNQGTFSNTFNSGTAGGFTQSLGFLPTDNHIWNTDLIFTLSGVTL